MAIYVIRLSIILLHYIITETDSNFATGFVHDQLKNLSSWGTFKLSFR